VSDYPWKNSYSGTAENSGLYLNWRREKLIFKVFQVIFRCDAPYHVKSEHKALTKAQMKPAMGLAAASGNTLLPQLSLSARCQSL
jgi:hypothetical protein